MTPLGPISPEQLPLLTRFLQQTPILVGTALTFAFLWAGIIVALMPLRWWMVIIGRAPTVPVSGEVDETEALLEESVGPAAQEEAVPGGDGESSQPEAIVTPGQVATTKEGAAGTQAAPAQAAASGERATEKVAVGDDEEEDEEINLEELSEVDDILSSVFSDENLVDPEMERLIASLEDVDIESVARQAKEIAMRLRQGPNNVRSGGSGKRAHEP